MERQPIALISVWDKQGIVEFAGALIDLGWRIVSSGGTCAKLREAGLAVTDVADITGQGPILAHRVATLHPHIHGGLLATEEMLEELEQLKYPWIDLVCVDLYPLEEEIANPNATRASVIAKTDIGGPTMLRSGAKGRRIVVCDPKDRAPVIDWLKNGQPFHESFVTRLAAKAEGVIAGYCLASGRYHSEGEIDGIIGTRVATCKYGENAWQQDAGLYSTGTNDPLALDKFELVAGTPPSYNNWCDVDRMLQTATHIKAGFTFSETAFAIAVKHGNPCGVAMGILSGKPSEISDHEIQLVRRMVEGDQRAIFGGLVMTTFGMTEGSAEALLTHGMEKGRRVLDGIVAPSFTEEAIRMLQRKGDKCRFLRNPALAMMTHESLDTAARLRRVRGGFLRQPNYTQVPDWKAIHLLVGDIMDIPLAWAIGSTSSSNTVTLVRDGMLIGNGVGQQDRVSCCELALKRARDAGHDPKGAVAYSDSFFPFPDGPQLLCDAGVRAIFATSGSVRDNETRAVCEKAGVRLYLLPDAEARGFFGH